MEIEFKFACDICDQGFTHEDLMQGRVIRLQKIGEDEIGSIWQRIGTGSGMAQMVAHQRCLDEKGVRLDFDSEA